jgi:hypothetical protein
MCVKILSNSNKILSKEWWDEKWTDFKPFKNIEWFTATERIQDQLVPFAGQKKFVL